MGFRAAYITGGQVPAGEESHYPVSPGEVIDLLPLNLQPRYAYGDPIYTNNLITFPSQGDFFGTYYTDINVYLTDNFDWIGGMPATTPDEAGLVGINRDTMLKWFYRVKRWKVSVSGSYNLQYLDSDPTPPYHNYLANRDIAFTADFEVPNLATTGPLDPMETNPPWHVADERDMAMRTGFYQIGAELEMTPGLDAPNAYPSPIYTTGSWLVPYVSFLAFGLHDPDAGPTDGMENWNGGTLPIESVTNTAGVGNAEPVYIYARLSLIPPIYDTGLYYIAPFGAVGNSGRFQWTIAPKYQSDYYYAYPNPLPGSTQTGGLLAVGFIYTILGFATGDDFTNVGAASNATGVIFVATGTTPTAWSNGSTIWSGKQTAPAMLGTTTVTDGVTTATTNFWETHQEWTDTLWDSTLVTLWKKWTAFDVTFTALKYHQYATKSGAPVYDEDTGAQINDPFS